MSSTSTAPSSPQSPHEVGHRVQSAIETHVGMLTCQVMELSIRLQAAQEEIARLQAEAQIARARAEAAEAPP